jgi:hypothetical protein
LRWSWRLTTIPAIRSIRSIDGLTSEHTKQGSYHLMKHEVVNIQRGCAWKRARNSAGSCVSRCTMMYRAWCQVKSHRSRGGKHVVKVIANTAICRSAALALGSQTAFKPRAACILAVYEEKEKLGCKYCKPKLQRPAHQNGIVSKVRPSILNRYRSGPSLRARIVNLWQNHPSPVHYRG